MRRPYKVRKTIRNCHPATGTRQPSAAHVPRIKSGHDPADAKLEISLCQIASYGADVTIYTDGSVFAGLFDGDAVAIIQGPSEDPTVIEPLQSPGRKFTS